MNHSNDIEQLTRAARLQADRLASQIGVSSAALRFGISRMALSNFLAALPSQRGTVLSIAYGLGLLSAVQAPIAMSFAPVASDLG